MSYRVVWQAAVAGLLLAWSASAAETQIGLAVPADTRVRIADAPGLCHSWSDLAGSQSSLSVPSPEGSAAPSEWLGPASLGPLQSADGYVDLVSVSPPCGTLLTRGAQVHFTVTVDYGLSGVDRAYLSAELGLANGRAVGIVHNYEVGPGTGRVNLTGTVDVDFLEEWLRQDATYDGAAYLAISIGVWRGPSEMWLLEWEHIPSCSYPVGARNPWPMFGQNPQRTGRTPSIGPGQPQLQWAFPTGGAVRSSPAIGGDGTIYVGSEDGRIYAINSNGTLKWNYQTGGFIISSPAIGADGTIYVGSSDGRVYAINPNGTLKWTFLTEDNVYSSPVIGLDGTIYVGAYECRLYAINPNGTLKWSFPGDGSFHSSPAIGNDGTIYAAGGGHLYAINADGTERWRRGGLPGASAFHSPAIGADGTIYVGTVEEKTLFAINPNGTLRWSLATGAAVLCSPAIGPDGTIYVHSVPAFYEGGPANVYAINPNGTQKWRFTTSIVPPTHWDPASSSPAVGGDGTIYVGSHDGHLHAINPNGTLKWSHHIGGPVISSPAIGADGTIYVGSNDGNLCAISGASVAHAPIARASEISGQPQVMYPDTEYTVTAKYFDPDGRTDLKYCYLRLAHPTKPLTMMWSQEDGHAAAWAGEEGANYLTTVSVAATPITEAGLEGYRLAWTFAINDQWPEVENAIDFGVFAMDRADLTSGWDYDNTKAWFRRGIQGAVPRIGVPPHAPVRLQMWEGMSVSTVVEVKNDGAAGVIALDVSTDSWVSAVLSADSVYLESNESAIISVAVRVTAMGAQSSVVRVTAQAGDALSICDIVWTAPVSRNPLYIGLGFENSTGEICRVRLEYPSYVLGPSVIAVPPGHTSEVGMVFDPSPWEEGYQGYAVDVKMIADGQGFSPWIMEVEFPDWRITTTSFRVSRDGYVFANNPMVKIPLHYVGLEDIELLGCCYGFAETSTLYYNWWHAVDPRQRPPELKRTYELPASDAVWYAIKVHFWNQDFFAAFRSYDAGEESRKLQTSLEQRRPILLGLWFRLQSSSREEGHAVTVYRSVRLGDSIYFVAYDNNYPYRHGSGPEVFPCLEYNTATGVFGFSGGAPDFEYGQLLKFRAVEPRPLKWLLAIIKCPVNVTIIDDRGRVISDAGRNEIPGAHIVVAGDTRIFQLPLDLSYSAEISGTVAGRFSFLQAHPVGQGMRILGSSDIACTSGTKAYVDLVPGAESYLLRIDANGDGRVDESRSPDFTYVIGYAPPLPPKEGMVWHGPNPVLAAGCIFWLNLPDDAVAATLKIFAADGALLHRIELPPTATRYPETGRWEPRDSRGRRLGTGLYLYLVEVRHADGRVTYSPVEKMVVTR